MKRIGALLLSFIMVFSMAQGAFAAPSTEFDFHQKFVNLKYDGGELIGTVATTGIDPSQFSLKDGDDSWKAKTDEELLSLEPMTNFRETEYTYYGYTIRYTDGVDIKNDVYEIGDERTLTYSDLQKKEDEKGMKIGLVNVHFGPKSFITVNYNLVKEDGTKELLKSDKTFGRFDTKYNEGKVRFDVEGEDKAIDSLVNDYIIVHQDEPDPFKYEEDDKVINVDLKKKVEKVKLSFDFKGGNLPTEISNNQVLKDLISNGKLSLELDKNTSGKEKLISLGLTEANVKAFNDKIEKRNYNFIGWKLLKGDTTYSIDSKINEDTEVYASWRANSVEPSKDDIKVTFNPNGGEFKDGDKDKYEYIKRGETVRERNVERPKRRDYTFKGWAEDRKKEKLFDFDTKINEDKTLYAVWERDDDRDRDRDKDKEKPKEPSRVIEKIEKLNKEDHFEYIQGYEDGSVRPDAKITREEVSAVFYRLLNEDYKKAIKTEKNSFKDVNQERWSNKHISTLSNGKIVQGYPDGEFKPTNNITRAEVAVIASRFDMLNPTKTNFNDVKGHWAEDYIGSAVSKGWIKGYPDGSFKPNEDITRAEFVSLVNNVLERKVIKENMLSGIKQFNDLKTDKWYYEDMVEATNGHIYQKRNVIEIWTQLKKFNFDM